MFTVLMRVVFVLATSLSMTLLIFFLLGYALATPEALARFLVNLPTELHPAQPQVRVDLSAKLQNC